VKTSGSKRIAERYVKALFEVAKAASAVEAVEKDFTSLADALKTSAEFRHFLVNPLLSPANRAEALLAILDKMKVSQLTRQFLGMVIQQKRLDILPEIIEEYARVASAARGELDAEVITATPLKDSEIAAVGERLGKAYGRKLRLNVKQDPALLGGIIVKIGSQQLDSSLAGKMRRLKNSLKAA
jgi:F-type H+-transporting ATPase subunit delta